MFIRRFKDGWYLVLLGDFGSGKTSLLLAMAKMSAEEGGGVRVIYIASMTKSGSIMDVNIAMRFQAFPAVEVWTMARMREVLGMEKKTVLSAKDQQEVLTQFVMKYGGKNIRLFCDEFPVLPLGG